MALLAASCTSASSPSSARSRKISTRPPEGLRPKARAANDAGVVEHQEVAGAQIRGQLAHQGVSHGAGGCLEHQQPARGAFRRWLLRDQLGGQIVGEVLAAHRGMVQRPLASGRIVPGHRSRRWRTCAVLVP